MAFKYIHSTCANALCGFVTNKSANGSGDLPMLIMRPRVGFAGSLRGNISFSEFPRNSALLKILEANTCHVFSICKYLV